MATIEWYKDAWQLFNNHVDYARFEFGSKTANKWLREMSAIDKRLRMHPVSYPLEPFLKDRETTFRFCPIMKRFKVIYYYDEVTDVVHIADIWDTMQNPATLIQRIE